MNLDQKAEPKKSLIKPKETVRLRQLKWLTLGRCGPPLINKWKNQFCASWKSSKFEKYNVFKPHLIHRIAHVTSKMRRGAVKL